MLRISFAQYWFLLIISFHRTVTHAVQFLPARKIQFHEELIYHITLNRPICLKCGGNKLVNRVNKIYMYEYSFDNNIVIKK